MTRKTLIELIVNGRGLEDAAETCGHDEELSDWQKSVKSIMKKYKITESDIKKFENQSNFEDLEKKKIKMDKEDAEKKIKDAAILAEFGIKQ